VAKRRDKGEEKTIAVRRLDQLLAAARAERSGGRPDLADRYGQLALAVAQKYQTGLEPRHKAELCRKCGAVAGSATRRVRVVVGRIVTTCLRCGDVRRQPLQPRASGAAR
jgi:ribonuclease P protein subunit RPR2